MVAVTGGIGSGKSTVSTRLAERGAVVVDSDQLAREVVAPGSAGLAAVAARFGADVLTPDGALNRPALAAIVFADSDARRDLEAITHPLVRQRFAALAAAAPASSIVVNDIPLLVDLAGTAQFHLVIGVGAATEQRVARLVRRGLTEVDARSRIAAQIDDERRRPLADVWLSNDGDVEALRLDVDRLWVSRLVPFSDALRAGRPGADSAAASSAELAAELAAAAAVSDEAADRCLARLRRVLGHVSPTEGGAAAARSVRGTAELHVLVSKLPGVDIAGPALAAAGFLAMPAAAGEFRCRWADPGQSITIVCRESITG